MKNPHIVWHQPMANRFNSKRVNSSLRNIQKTLKENGIPFEISPSVEIKRHHAISVPANLADVAANLIIKNNGRNYGGADWLAHMAAAGRS